MNKKCEWSLWEDQKRTRWMPVMCDYNQLRELHNLASWCQEWTPLRSKDSQNTLVKKL